MSALRILHVVPYYEQAWAYGGIPRLATAMTRALARRGHQVTVCTTDACDAASRTSLRSSHTALAGLDVHVFPNASNRLAYHLQFFTPLGLSSYLRTRAHQFDVAHLHACRNLPGSIAARALRRSGVPYVTSPNGTAPAIERRILAKRLFDWTIGRRTLSGSARILAVSESEHRQLRTLGIDAARIRIIPNPIDEGEFTAPPDGVQFRRRHGLGDGPVVLFLGKLTPRKGVDVLVRAFQQLARPDATLVIAGNDMGSARALDVLIGALALQQRTYRIGLLRGAERLEALAAADVVVYPSQAEVFGLVAVEALICGTPVVVCDDSGCGEIVRDVGGGICVRYGDASRLARAIGAILDSKPTWRSKARSAAKLARDRFGSTAVGERLEELYREVLRHGVTAA